MDLAYLLKKQKYTAKTRHIHIHCVNSTHKQPQQKTTHIKEQMKQNKESFVIGINLEKKKMIVIIVEGVTTNRNKTHF